MQTNNGESKRTVVQFDLEVCLLPAVDMIGMICGDGLCISNSYVYMVDFAGIRRKRRTGDIWEFKRICEKIFKATHL